ncbi:MAG: LysM peptidoglycan-binding domain-containing protein [bacterium]
MANSLKNSDRLHKLRSLMIVVSFSAFAFSFLLGCGGSKKIVTNSVDTIPKVVKDADPFATLDDHNTVLDSAIIEERLEAARQEWLRALAAEQRKDKNEVVRRFEGAIDILNRLIYFPNLKENKDFQELTKSVLEDYEKFVAKIDVLPPSASIFALRQKFNEEMSKMDIRNIPVPKSPIVATQVPLTMNPDVEKTIAYFMQGNGRTFFTKWLTRSKKFIPKMKEIFRQEGTPEELVYLSMIESGLNPTVTSKAQAVGLWQFIEGTGSMYGLKSNWWLDNRRDPWKATRAAARHLKDLYKAMGDWHLALACYDCSMTRIRRCMAESNNSTFWGIRDCLPKETQNYIPLYIAAATIAMDPTRYGFTNISYENPVEYDTVYVHEAVDLNAIGTASGVSGLEIKSLNPELLQPSTPPLEVCGANGYCVKIPIGTAKKFYERYAKLTPEEKRPWLVHTVERGESLRSIAKSYGLTTEQLADYNNLETTEKVRRGARIRVPMSVMAPQAIASNDSTGSSAPAPTPVVKTASKTSHRVKRGETLNSIAAHYGVRVSDIRNWNNISYRHKLKRGQLLSIYIERGPKRAPTNDLAKKTTSTPNENADPPTGKPRIHSVRPGETMSSIARNFGTSVDKLAEWNDGMDPASLQAGQKLKLYAVNKTSAKGDSEQPQRKSTRTIYRVRSGDTLSSIANEYGISLTKLKKANHLKRNTIPVGKRLTIPQ